MDDPGSTVDGVGELYALDPGDFVAARDDLVRRLRKAGDRDLAAEVAKLRRPSPAAWAVNQLARRHPEAVEDLLRVGEALQAEQGRALGGGQPGTGPGGLRQAARARRDAVARLVEMAEAVLAERGGVAGAAGGVASTLEAASLDQGAAAAVRAGRLTSELRPPPGFGAFDLPVAASDLPVAEPAPAAEAPPPRRPTEEAEAAAAEAATAELRGMWERRAAQARAAVARVEESRGALQDTEAEVARLEERLAEARGRARVAARDHERAEHAASEAEEAAARAAARLREADKRLRQVVEDASG